MYQGTNKTACASQRQIAAAMLELMREQPYDSLSVLQICKRAGISRPTFYSLFQSKENVVAFLLMQDCCDTPDENCSETDMLRALCHGFEAYVMRQEDLLRLLSANHILQFLQGTLTEIFSGCECFSACGQDDLKPYAPAFVAAGLTSIVETWLCDHTGQSGIEDIAYQMLRGAFYV